MAQAATSSPHTARAGRVVLSPEFLRNLMEVLPRLLTTPGALPDDWEPTATTYDLPRFDSEDRFAARLDQTLSQLLANDVKDPVALQAALYACGLPFDYARLGQPLSTVLELVWQARSGAARAYSFASVTKPWLAVIESPARTLPVRVFADADLPVSPALKAMLRTRGVELHEQHRGDLPPARADMLTIHVRSTMPQGSMREQPADAVCFSVPGGGGLLIADATRIDPHGIQLIRKRTVSALLAVDARDALERLAGVTATPHAVTDTTTCDTQLRTLFPELRETLYFCTGLAAEAAVFAAVADVLGPKRVTFFYAQNGYGGTGQLMTDVLATMWPLTPAPLAVLEVDAAGQQRTLVDAIISRLATLDGSPACVFVETPTNPELQVHDFAALMTALRAYQAKWGQQIPLLVDTTLAPLYPVFHYEYAKDWPVILVKSGSKYFTKGKTTLGVVAAAAHLMSQQIMARARELGHDADSFARPGQLALLRDGLADLPTRMQTIGHHTTRLAQGILQALAARGHAITLYAMSDAQAEQGLWCGLISFYLPAAPTDHADLVDEFVHHLLTHAPMLVKSRVSYGQSSGPSKDRDWFYVINPQESTQGSLPEAVKRAQKRDNVQICRISVPEHADVDALLAAMEPFFDEKYGQRR